MYLFVRSRNQVLPPDIILSAGDTPLMVAVESELTPTVVVLVKEGGADVNYVSETTGE